MRRLLLTLALGGLLAACSTEGVPQGTLTLEVSGLPQGATPSIRLKGPVEQQVSGSATLKLPVGTYTVEAQEVVLQSGERYYPSQVDSPVEVKRNQEAQAKVVYALDQNSLPGELALVVNGLPEGAEAAVSVENPDRGVKVAVKASTVLRLQAGTYLVKASRVSYGGMDYVPSPAQGSVVLEPGKRASYAVSYGPAKGELLVRIEGLPDGLSARVEVKDGQGSVVAALAESRVLSLPPGTYFVSAKDVVAQDGTTYRGSVSGSPATVRAGERAEVAVSYNALPKPSFSLSLSPASLTAQQGGSAQTTLTLTPKNGFTGTVFLSLEASGGGSVSGIALSPQSLQVAGSDPVNQVLVLQVASSVSPGTYTLQVKATSGSIAAQATLTLTVSAPSLSLSLSPSSLSVAQGGTGSLTLTLTPRNGFSGAVAFSLEGAPDGVSLAPQSATLDGTGPVSVQAALSVASSVAPGTYTFNVVAAGGGVSATAVLTLSVPTPTFAFSLQPSSVTLTQGASATLVASLTSQGGFSGSVAFSLASPPAGFVLSGGPYDLERDQGVDVPLFLSVDSSVAPGTYQLVVEARSGAVVKRALLQVQVSSATGQLALGIYFQDAPAGAQGYVVVQGLSGTFTVVQSSTLTLKPGTYTITAYSVDVNGVHYVPNPPGGTVEVQAGATATFAVNYTRQ